MGPPRASAQRRDTSQTAGAARVNSPRQPPAPEAVGEDYEVRRHTNELNSMAANATLHCLTGCAIGEILGLMIGTAVGLSTTTTIVLAVSLAFLFGYALSTLPLLQAGLGVFCALSVVFAADTLSIATMEVVDNTVMALVPGAMDAGLVNPLFWITMIVALGAAFAAAFPVNRHLIARGKGHALTHRFHHDSQHVAGPHRGGQAGATRDPTGHADPERN